MTKRAIMIAGSQVTGGLACSLKHGFEAIGWSVLAFDDMEIFLAQNRWTRNRYAYRLFWPQLAKVVQERLLAELIEAKPEVLLIIKGFYFSPAAILRIKKRCPNMLLMHFNPDNSFNTWHFGNSNRWIRDSIPIYDAHLTWGEFLVSRLGLAGAKKVFHLPFACDPSLHYPVDLSQAERAEYGADVAFVGSWDEEREAWLSHLLDFRLKIWGNDWHKASQRIQSKWQKKAVIKDEFSKVCLASKINLNFIRKQNVPAHNMRTFEIPACKGFMLSTRTSEQQSIWVEGDEIACFSTPEELKHMIEYYRSNDQARFAMAARAHKKVYELHSYRQRASRIEKIWLDLGSSENGPFL